MTNIEQLPSPALLNRSSKEWGLSNLRFVRKMENIVYECDCGAARVFLRLTTPLRRVRPEIEAELNWIEHLAKCGIQVPRVVLSAKGNRIVSLTEGEQHFEAVVFSAIEGQHPSMHIVSNPEFLRTLGALIAKMHDAAKRFETSHQEKREEWNEERGLRHALAAAAVSKHSELRDKLEDAISWMSALQKSPETYGLVHADLGALNLFVGEDLSISIIDFDDSCYHWFAFDLAIVIYSMAMRFEHRAALPQERMWLNDLLEGYRTIRSLSSEEVNWIPKFMDFATLRLFFWIEHHEMLHTFHDDAIDRIAKVKQWCANRICSFQ